MQPKPGSFKLLGQFPAAPLLAPRQVGKTTLALSLSSEALYVDLGLPSDRAKLADLELYLSDYEERLMILDEIHRLPGIFQTLRGLIDRRKRKGNAPGISSRWIGLYSSLAAVCGDACGQNSVDRADSIPGKRK